jgi:hypothetical protein
VTGWRFLGALLAVPLAGLPLERPLFAGSRNACARLGFSGAAGAVLLCFEMLLLTALGVPWSVWLLVSISVAFLLVSRQFVDPQRGAAEHTEPASPLDIFLILVTLGVVAFATGTARATGGDFLLFWGTKGEHFALSRSIDVSFLRDPFNSQLHPLYPPLVPLLYAWGSMVAGGLSWEAAVLLMPIALALTGLVFLGFAESVLGRPRATTLTSVLIVLLGLVMIAVPVAGNAEPLLLYFEAVSLCALLFRPVGKRSFAVAGIGLAGAAMTKVEGSIFALLVIIAHLLLGRNRTPRALAALALPSLLMVAGWIAICHVHGIGEQYALPSTSNISSLRLIVREMGRQASFGVGYVPWVVPLLIAIGGRWTPGARTGVAVTLGFVGAMACIYLGGGGDPRLWIVWSAGRLFMTPLLCLFLAAAASQGAKPTSESAARAC